MDGYLIYHSLMHQNTYRYGQNGGISHRRKEPGLLGGHTANTQQFGDRGMQESYSDSSVFVWRFVIVRRRCMFTDFSPMSACLSMKRIQSFILHGAYIILSISLFYQHNRTPWLDNGTSWNTNITTYTNTNVGWTSLEMQYSERGIYTVPISCTLDVQKVL